jgi:hypothetical protein
MITINDVIRDELNDLYEKDIETEMNILIKHFYQEHNVSPFHFRELVNIWYEKHMHDSSTPVEISSI